MSRDRFDPFIDFDKIQQIQQELGRLFDGDWVEPTAANSASDHWKPSTDTVETDSAYVFMIDLPGVKLDNIDVSLRDGCIHVTGEQPATTVGEVVRRERHTGKFERVITLPDNVDESTLAATMRSGVLSLTVNRDAGVASRSIPVREVD